MTELIKVGDDLEIYGRENDDTLAFNLGRAVRSLGLMARIERRDSNSDSQNEED